MRVGIYIGSVQSSNIEKVLSSWRDYFSSEVELELFGSSNLSENLKPGYNKFDTTSRNSFTPIDLIFQVYRDGIEYIRQRSPDFIISLTRYYVHAPGLTLAGYHTDTPVVVRFIADVFHEYQKWNGIKQVYGYALSHLFGRIPIRYADHIIVLGPYGKSEVTSRGANQGEVTMLPPPPDINGQFVRPSDSDVSDLRSQLDLPPDQYIALYVGRLTEAKGMLFLKQVIEQSDNTTFVIVGDGPYSEHFRNEYGQHVNAIGYVPHSEIDLYYKSADVYIHPSPYEGLPLVIIEALECGLPVIAREAGDIKFVTPHIVDSPSEMVNMIENNSPEFKWLNHKYFTDEFQSKTINNIINSVVG